VLRHEIHRYVRRSFDNLWDNKNNSHHQLDRALSIEIIIRYILERPTPNHQFDIDIRRHWKIYQGNQMIGHEYTLHNPYPLAVDHNHCLQDFVSNHMPRVSDPSHDEPLPAYLSQRSHLLFTHQSQGSHSLDTRRSLNDPLGPDSARILELPIEILFHIMEYLPNRSVRNLRLTCREIAMYNPVCYQSFWRSRFFYGREDYSWFDDGNRSPERRRPLLYIPDRPGTDWRRLWWYMFRPWSVIAATTSQQARVRVRECIARFGSFNAPPCTIEGADNAYDARLGNRTKSQIFDNIGSWKNQRRVAHLCKEILRGAQALANGQTDDQV